MFIYHSIRDVFVLSRQTEGGEYVPQKIFYFIE